MEFLDALQFNFLRNALIAGVLVSIACGIIGTFVVINRIVFISGGIAHTAYGGIGLGYFFGFNPVWGAILFSVLSALGMGTIQRSTRQRADTMIGVMWAIGMALGILLIDLTPGYKSNLMSYLFGSILTVSTYDLGIILVLDLAIIVLVALFFKELIALSFDETFATVSNVPVQTLALLLLVLIAFTVVMLMQVVGLIMVIALLTMPAAISTIVTRDMRVLMVLSSFLGCVFTMVGIWLSYTFDLTSGATIIMVAGVTYIGSLLIKTQLRRFRSASAVKSETQRQIAPAE